MKNLKFVIIIIVCAAAGSIGMAVLGSNIIYNYGLNFYEDRLLPGTYINGTDCSQMSIAQAKDALQKQVEDYNLELVERDGKTESITGSQLGLEYVDDGSVDKILEEQDASTWVQHLNNSEDYKVEAAYDYDESYISYLVKELDCLNEANVTEPVSAYIDENDSGFYIVPEVVGNEVDQDKLTTLVKEAVADKETSIDLEAEGAYIEPTYTSESPELASALEQNNKFLSADVTYDFTDRTYHVDKTVIKGFLVKNTDGSYSIDESKVNEWVSNMAYETDTFGLPRTFMTSYGVEIQLEGGGDYGWYMDTETTAAQLVQYLYAGTVITTEPNYIYSACSRATNDIGGTYVEVCIANQTVWGYVDGQCVVSSGCVSGCVNLGRSTPSGSVWAIDAKKTDWEFTTFPGSFADYWMPFNGECGLHDASWQAAFGGDIYLNSGSHGCVNLPLETAQILYEYMEIGYPVVVYYSLDQVHGPDPTEELVAG